MAGDGWRKYTEDLPNQIEALICAAPRFVVILAGWITYKLGRGDGTVQIIASRV